MRPEPPGPAAARRRRPALPLLALGILALLLVPPPRSTAAAEPDAAPAEPPGLPAAEGPPAVAAPAPGGDEGYSLGVFPYLPPLALDRIFAPIVGGLSREIGRPVRLRTKDNFEAFTGELSVGGYDLALVHPFLYVTAAAGYGYVPLVRVDEPLRVVFLGRADDGMARLADLAGRTLALPGPLTAVSEMAKLALVEIGLRPGVDVQVQHYQTKLSCVQALAMGAAAACGLPSFALTQIELARGDDFRVFDERSLPVGLAVLAGPRLGEAERRRLAEAMVAWSATPEGRAALAEEGWPGLVPARERDFDPVRALLARSHRLALQR